MPKILLLFVLCFFSVLIAGVYGIIHDQITVTISPEYYTEFKFHQFKINHNHFSLRAGASIVGFLATWWAGIPIGIILGALTVFMFPRSQSLRQFIRAIGLVFLVTIVFGILGYLFGSSGLKNPDYLIPKNVVDTSSYIKVGIIHSYSYLGGLIGLICGVFYLIWRKSQVLKM